MRKPTLLVIEDDPIDVLAMRRCVRHHKLDVELLVAGDGEEGLQSVADLADRRPLPELLILLDINMPRMNGFEFLEALRSGHHYAQAPTFVVSTSNDAGDRRRAYADGVTGYICKDRLNGDYGQLADLVRSFFSLVSQPETDGPPPSTSLAAAG